MEITPINTEETSQAPAARAGLRARAGALLRANIWFILPMAVLILARALLIHSSPTDFPVDRNITAANKIRWLMDVVSRMPLGTEFFMRTIWVTREAPEFPFIPLSAWMLTKTGLDPIVAARLASLAFSILAGVGLYILGRRLGPPGLGVMALWAYALNPLAVHMGRGLLPDHVMVTAVIWSIAAAEGGLGKSRISAAAWTAFWLVIASLAKMPAIIFAPVAAAALMRTMGWRRPSSWVSLALVAAVTYWVTCKWYKIDLLSPMAGINRISASTNHAMDTSLSIWFGPPLLKVIAGRFALALTVPGLVLALIGWFILQRHPRGRLELNLWFILAVYFIAVTISTNTYWVYMVAPIGCLLAALAVVEFYRISHWSVVPLGVATCAALWLCPGVGRVRDYLLIRPEYPMMGEAAQRLVKSDDNLYVGQIPGDIDYFVRRRGISKPNPDAGVIERLKKGLFHNLITNHMGGNDFIGSFFYWKPILETRPGQFIIYDTDANTRLGERLGANEGIKPGVNVDLEGVLRIVDVKLQPSPLKPGEPLEMQVVYERGPQYRVLPTLALEFVRRPDGPAFRLPPIKGGATFITWPSPLLQTPDFSQGPRLRMSYAFETSPYMPTGQYDLRLTLLEDPRMKKVLGQPVNLPVPLDVPPPAGPASLPMFIEPADCLWTSRNFRWQVPWMGKPKRFAGLGPDAQAYLRPNLPPGRYDLSVTGYGTPAWVSPTDVWPVMKVDQAGAAFPSLFTFYSGEQTISATFQWRGTEDYVRLSLDNPASLSPPRVSLPLNLADVTGGTRGIVIERIAISRATN